jgi:hypothetical protein
VARHGARNTAATAYDSRNRYMVLILLRFPIQQYGWHAACSLFQVPTWNLEEKP